MDDITQNFMQENNPTFDMDELYCHESITDLDDIVHIPSQVNNDEVIPSRQSKLYQHLPQFDIETKSNVIRRPAETMTLSDHKIQSSIQGVKSSVEKDSSKSYSSYDFIPREKNPRERKFVKGLLNEFNKHGQSTRSCTVSITQVRNTEQEVPDVISEEEIYVDDEEDVLVIPNSLMTSSGVDSDSGSDIDWSSLTPPVPGSPSDHRVPDMDDDTITDIQSRYDQHPMLDERDQSFDSYFGHGLIDFNLPLHNVSYSSSPSDHVVPQMRG